MSDRTAVIAGVGPGLGESLARKFASEECAVGLFARSDDYIRELAAELREGTPGNAIAVPTDITDEDEVRAGFDAVRNQLGRIDVLVNHASAASWEGLLNESPDEFEKAWRTTAYGAFVCSQEAARDMLDGDGGTIIFTGATSAVRGRGGAVGFSSAKFAARGMAESMARELGSKGIHVAHVVIDGQINTPRMRADDTNRDSFLDPDEIAEEYWHLVEQDRTAWTLELDLRPYVEEF
ncbi:MAG: SDR family NAD(P)-dependent oxidoreductase [Halobacteria archaeon]|nr:SDR family NAD(P)-dependent oxidoreductase [Halobacteria archaeon]